MSVVVVLVVIVVVTFVTGALVGELGKSVEFDAEGVAVELLGATVATQNTYSYKIYAYVTNYCTRLYIYTAALVLH